MKFAEGSICLVLLIVSHAFSQTKSETNSYLKQATISESDGKIQITANSPRPLAQAFDALQQKFGWVLNYEDPTYTSGQDVAEIGGPDAGKVPAGGRFTVEFAASQNQDKEKAVQSVVDAYNQSENPGRFELRKTTDGVISIVGVEAHDDKGKISKQKAIFDTPISIIAKERTVEATLNLICGKVAALHQVRVTMGVTPRNLVIHNTVKVGGTKMSARDLILRTLALTQRNIYWRLLYDPNSRGYFLNLHLVPKPAADSKKS